MGHLINPISVRLGVIRSWDSKCGSASEFFYKNLLKNNCSLNKVLEILLNQPSLWRLSLFFSHYKIYQLLDKLVIKCYLYDGLKRNHQRYLEIWNKKSLTKYRFRASLWQRFKGKLIENKKFKKTDWPWDIRNALIDRAIIDNNKNILARERLLWNSSILYVFWYFKIHLKKFFPALIIDLKFCFLANNELRASSLVSFMIIKLNQKFRVPALIRWIRKIIVNYVKPHGFKLQLSGRFTRKQRASKFVLSYGTLPLNTMTALIDYAFKTVVLKYSVCGIKVWLHFGGKPIVKASNKYLKIKRKLRYEKEFEKLKGKKYTEE